MKRAKLLLFIKDTAWRVHAGPVYNIFRENPGCNYCRLNPFADVYNDAELYFQSGLFISYVILRDLNSRHKPAHILIIEER